MTKTTNYENTKPNREKNLKFLLLSFISYFFILISMIMISSLIIYFLYSLNPELINNWVIPENKYYMQTGKLLGSYFFGLIFISLIINTVYSYRLYNKYITDNSINLLRKFSPAYFLSSGLILSSVIFYTILDSQNVSKINKLAIDFKPDLQQVKLLNKFERSTLRGQSTNGNANEIYNNLIDSKKNFKVSDEDIKKIKIGKYLIKADSSVTNKYEKEIQLIRNGTTYSHVNNSFEPTFDTKLPNYISAQNLSRLMTSKAIDLYQNSNPMQGAETLLDTIRFGQDIGNSSVLISSMVGIAIDKIAISNLSEQLGMQKLDKNELTQLLVQIEKLMETEIDTQKAFTFEGLTMKNEILKMGQGKIDYRYLLSMNTIISNDDNYLLTNKFLIRPQIIDAVKKLDQIQPEIQEFIITKSNNLELIQEKMEKILKVIDSNYLLYYMIPNFSSVAERVKSHKANLEGLYIHTALQTYFSIHNKYPQKLSELSPSIIKSIPSDPFTNKEFIYNLKGNSYTLYSSGKDLKDNDGDMDSDLVIFPVKDTRV